MDMQTPDGGAAPTAAQGVFINNRWQAGASGKTIPVAAPAEGRVFAAIAAGDATDVDLAVRAARAAVDGGAWGKLSATERGRLLPARLLRHDRARAPRRHRARDPVELPGADVRAHRRPHASDGHARVVKPAEELPFGGIKKSGHGREKGFAALHDVSTLRTMIIKHG